MERVSQKDAEEVCMEGCTGCVIGGIATLKKWMRTDRKLYESISSIEFGQFPDEGRDLAAMFFSFRDQGKLIEFYGAVKSPKDPNLADIVEDTKGLQVIIPIRDPSATVWQGTFATIVEALPLS